ncbi:MAG: hypothetical protein EAZ78_01275 [Oscillatoriales cyanobacterium]|nr:MAG: hypothetical protein EA000_14475 [Oscillatoriales cyanobacterium]TAD93819.1 MAG: hypothetical protein EAZ98_21435 [Oscillatoriales cyanobacterium]TAE01362.1 MAG: hypothetical protein EAZ96_19260 [Oscillatoriales cyanobacterium]TAF06934.1 MAG: hypothetical protein EAZ78_01275 [Oscillatoriales cyanobacterium]TAF47217.1 MAG: hypothetical protein EAZ68_02335 [Oscillatoriales cyanobacterium]
MGDGSICDWRLAAESFFPLPSPQGGGWGGVLLRKEKLLFYRHPVTFSYINLIGRPIAITSVTKTAKVLRKSCQPPNTANWASRLSAVFF